MQQIKDQPVKPCKATVQPLITKIQSNGDFT